MKSFVLHLKKNPRAFRLPSIRRSGAHNMRDLLSRYGIQGVFAALFLLGLIVGATSGHSYDETTSDTLDLLFVTNIGARQEMRVFDIFVSCFVSYFLFIFCAFLSAISAWGFVAIPALSAFKGFVVGLSSAFIFSLYRLSGVGFYILVVLPGTVLFLFTLIRYSAHGFRVSLRYAGFSLFGTEREPQLRQHLKVFLKQTLFAILGCCACAVIDMVLWVLFAGKFDF